jgi:hypothetical protein
MTEKIVESLRPLNKPGDINTVLYNLMRRSDTRTIRLARQVMAKLAQAARSDKELKAKLLASCEYIKRNKRDRPDAIDAATRLSDWITFEPQQNKKRPLEEAAPKPSKRPRKGQSKSSSDSASRSGESSDSSSESEDDKKESSASSMVPFSGTSLNITSDQASQLARVLLQTSEMKQITDNVDRTTRLLLAMEKRVFGTSAAPDESEDMEAVIKKYNTHPEVRGSVRAYFNQQVKRLREKRSTLNGFDLDMQEKIAAVPAAALKNAKRKAAKPAPPAEEGEDASLTAGPAGGEPAEGEGAPSSAPALPAPAGPATHPSAGTDMREDDEEEEEEDEEEGGGAREEGEGPAWGAGKPGPPPSLKIGRPRPLRLPADLEMVLGTDGEWSRKNKSTLPKKNIVYVFVARAAKIQTPRPEGVPDEYVYGRAWEAEEERWLDPSVINTRQTPYDNSAVDDDAGE